MNDIKTFYLGRQTICQVRSISEKGQKVKGEVSAERSAWQ